MPACRCFLQNSASFSGRLEWTTVRQNRELWIKGNKSPSAAAARRSMCEGKIERVSVVALLSTKWFYCFSGPQMKLVSSWCSQLNQHGLSVSTVSCSLRFVSSSVNPHASTLPGLFPSGRHLPRVFLRMSVMDSRYRNPLPWSLNACCCPWRLSFIWKTEKSTSIHHRSHLNRQISDVF